jgi:radical SAM superfamily enzyme YgiQ (UPF0313 family)
VRFDATNAARAALRRPGGVLLISCYELGHQPLALASPLAFLEQAGYAPAVLDVAVEPWDAERVARARFVGISVPMHTALRLGVRVAEQVRAINPECHLCFYGLYATLNAGYLFDHGADSVIGGEYEAPLVALVEALAAGERGLSVGATSKEPHLARLAFIAPSRDALPPLERYAHLEMEGELRVAGYVEASRGCKHMCRHCPIPPVYGGRFFVVPREVVLADVRRLVAAGARHITFGDADFLNGPGHALRVTRAVHAEFPDLTFDFTAKVEHILKHRDLFPELAALGCVFMVSAVESLSDRVLAILDKGHTRADVAAAWRVLRDARIAMRPSLVSFTPWTTLEDYQEVLAFVAAEGLIPSVDPVQYSIRLLIPPGSALLGHPELEPYLGPLIEATLTYAWTHPDARMDRLHRLVSAVVEQAAKAGEAIEATFARICDLAWSVAGGAEGAREGGGEGGREGVTRDGRVLSRDHSLAPSLPPSPPLLQRPPRLTEAWFC